MNTLTENMCTATRQTADKANALAAGAKEKLKSDDMDPKKIADIINSFQIRLQKARNDIRNNTNEEYTRLLEALDRLNKMEKLCDSASLGYKVRIAGDADEIAGTLETRKFQCSTWNILVF
ncbi:MAG: hypothetical protein LBE97_00940 [Holosporales bacterium]|jgi:hypothetical protein|nr:hypothetical protein [Holosporales bacterium]